MVERHLIKMKIKSIFFVLFFAFIFQSTVLSQEENINSAKSSADSGTSQSVKKESDSASVSNRAVSNQEQLAKVENNKQQKPLPSTSETKPSQSDETSPQVQQSESKKEKQVEEKKPSKNVVKKNKSETQKKVEEKPDTENSQNEDLKYDLPQVEEEEVEKNLSLNQDSPKKDNSKNLIWTIISWVLIGLGAIIIMVAIISGFKSSKEGEIYLNSKYSAKKYHNKNNRYK